MIFANDVDYWKTGRKRSPGQWVDLAIKQLEDHGASDIIQANGERDGCYSYMLQFVIRDAKFMVVWPVLPLPDYLQNETNKRASLVQAATSLYHEVKHACVRSTRYGPSFGFALYKMLPNGQTLQEISDPALVQETAFAALPPPE